MDTPITYDTEVDLDILLTEKTPVTTDTRKWQIKSYSELSSKLNNKDDLNKDRLQNMGFKTSSIGDDNNTSIIYPKDGVSAGESLPVVIMQGGDGANKKYYSNFFNEYRNISGTDLPRAIYARFMTSVSVLITAERRLS